MFEIEFGKLVLIGIVALIGIGPKELPAVLRMVGQWTTKIRRMAAEFQGQWHEAMREAEMSDLKKHIDQISDATHMGSGLDPVETVRKELEGAVQDKPASPPAGEAAAPSASAPSASAPSAEAAPAAPVDAQVPLPDASPTAPGVADVAPAVAD